MEQAERHLSMFFCLRRPLPHLATIGLYPRCHIQPLLSPLDLGFLPALTPDHVMS